MMRGTVDIAVIYAFAAAKVRIGLSFLYWLLKLKMKQLTRPNIMQQLLMSPNFDSGSYDRPLVNR